ncbi:hypothetical protein VTK73DRAFT_3786 [Phialemonium thermophilum]|uniref:Parasitic phase-specific protein PSP-1 n=1 Tax=Phialemonium thermophilum TaxID=223376 RepID=A0ABR3WX15_9PEZI
MSLPDGLISYGPSANCTLALCPVEWSALEYRPSLAASGAFIGLFAVAMVVHIIEGWHWRDWGFMSLMAAGCIDEIIGYGGRIILYNNPFSFSGFLMQIICITTAPLFFCASIYVTLSRTIYYLDPKVSYFSPKLLYWVFIPCDIFSLVLQAAGGGLSSVSSGSSKTGNDISLAGLSFQVFTLIVFIVLAADYFRRFLRSGGKFPGGRFRVYFIFLSLAILLILVRCVYRIDELSDGYFGPLFHNEEVFYGLESVMVTVATFSLALGHPGLGLVRQPNERSIDSSALETGAESGEK